MGCKIAPIAISADDTILYTKIEPEKVIDPETGDELYKVSSDDVVRVNEMPVRDFGNALGIIVGLAAIAILGIGIGAGLMLGRRMKK